METIEFLGLILAILAAAALYSSVGHGGASGYLAAMALFGLSAQTMKPAALLMNVFVTGVVLLRLVPLGYLRWRLFLPLAAASIPLAYIGGGQKLTDPLYQIAVGTMLSLAALRFFMEANDGPATGTPRVPVAMAIGAVLGYVSGLTGVGGGIFLSPLLLLLRWADVRTGAAVAAAFILVNSVAGLVGHAHAGLVWPEDLPVFVAVAVAGGIIGSALAARRLAPVKLRKLLGGVLTIAGVKMFFVAASGL